MTSPLLVIICTHNPRKEYLRATLAGLRNQSLPATAWNLLLVDNASAEPVSGWVDLAWHPHASIVNEPMVGTAQARHRALREAAAVGAGLILFVDDDNILEPDYLVQGLQLGADWPQLGAWGGQLLPRYEMPPPDWLGRYLNYLAITPLATDRWTNCVHSYDMVPPTAGCFLRPAVWRRYLVLVSAEPRRLTLGAHGGEPVRGEDTDLVLTAIDLNLGLGRFRALRLDHLIPAGRFDPHYVARLVCGTALGIGLMEYIRFQRIPRKAGPSRLERLLLDWRARRLPEPHRSILLAELRGRAEARRTIMGWRQAPAEADLRPATIQP